MKITPTPPQKKNPKTKFNVIKIAKKKAFPSLRLLKSVHNSGIKSGLLIRAMNLMLMWSGHYMLRKNTTKHFSNEREDSGVLTYKKFLQVRIFFSEQGKKILILRKGRTNKKYIEKYPSSPKQQPRLGLSKAPCVQ